MVVHERTLLDRASHGLALVSFLVPELDDHAACALVLACLVALRQYPPGAHGMLPCCGLPLSAAMRVVDRIHRDAAHGGPHATPANASGLADRLEAVLLVADLAGTQPQLRVAALSCKQLNRGARGARELCAPAGLHLDAVNRGADGDVPKRQGITRFDRRLHSRHELRAGGHTLGRDDVAALAVGVAEQGDVRASVRVVLEPLDLGRNAVLVAAKIDDAVILLVPAALVAHGDVAVDVAAGLFRLLLDQGLIGPTLVQIRVYELDELPPAG